MKTQATLDEINKWIDDHSNVVDGSWMINSLAVKSRIQVILTAHEGEIDIVMSCPDKRAYDRYVLDCQGDGLEPLCFDDWKVKLDTLRQSISLKSW